MKKVYVTPLITKQGSVEELTQAVMDFGAGDANFTILQHNDDGSSEVVGGLS
jgi:hypothetical protein